MSPYYINYNQGPEIAKKDTIDEKIQADTAEYGEMSTMLDFIAPHALSLLSNVSQTI